MASISHWGCFEIDAPSDSRDPLWAFMIDWEEVLRRRFPGGVAVIETPFSRLFGGGSLSRPNG